MRNRRITAGGAESDHFVRSLLCRFTAPGMMKMASALVDSNSEVGDGPALAEVTLYINLCIIELGSSGIPGGYPTKRLIKAPSSALPRFRTL